MIHGAPRIVHTQRLFSSPIFGIPRAFLGTPTAKTAPTVTISRLRVVRLIVRFLPIALNTSGLNNAGAGPRGPLVRFPHIRGCGYVRFPFSRSEALSVRCHLTICITSARPDRRDGLAGLWGRSTLSYRPLSRCSGVDIARRLSNLVDSNFDLKRNPRKRRGAVEHAGTIGVVRRFNRWVVRGDRGWRICSAQATDLLSASRAKASMR